MKLNYKLLIPTLILCLLSLLFIYSASSFSAQKEMGDAFFFVKKQGMALVFGLILCFACQFFDFSKLKKWKYVLLVLAYVLLALVFIPGIGTEAFGAKRWISIFGLSLQPSEISKFLYIFFLAGYFSEVKNYKFLQIVPAVMFGLGLAVLIMLEPNMSITMCVVLSLFAMLFISGVKIKYIAAFLLPVVVAVPALILLEPYRFKRLLAFIDPFASPKGEGYQLLQSLYGISAGGIFGVGIGNSRQKYAFLPFAESDFIFSIIIEGTGILGAICIIILFSIIIYQGIKIAMRAQNRFDMLLAGGITCIIAIQTMLNMAVVTGSIPPTGLPMPFVSYGGSSLAVFLAGIGILLNIDRKTNSSSAKWRTNKWFAN